MNSTLSLNSLVKLKINLEIMPNSVYRRVLLSSDLNMLQLHFIIQITMGWEFAHLFQFSDKRNATLSIGIPSDFDFDDVISADEVSLKDTFEEGYNRKPFWYWYDFGDDWWHKITFQKPTKADLKVYAGIPVCVDAVGKCPPEDVGGPLGYASFLDIISDSKHPEYQDLREWAGLSNNEAYDVDHVNIGALNQSLETFFKSDNWEFKLEDYL